MDHEQRGRRLPTSAVLTGLVLIGPALEGAAVLGRPVAAALTLLLLVYRRVVSPLLGPRCRFHPTCSAYALDAVAAHGPLRGVAMTLVRLAKCGPWHPGGLDPVPSRPRRRIGAPVAGPAPITEEHAH